MRIETPLLACISLIVLPLMLTSIGEAAIDIATVAAYWTFDEGSGDKVGDSSGNGNDGTNAGAKWVNGESGKALEFKLGTLVEVPHSASLDITDEITVTAWIKTEHPGLQTFIGKDDDSADNRSWHFCTEGGALRFNTWAPGGVQMNAGAAVNTGDWVFVAATFDGSFMKLYADGVLDAEQAAAGKKLSSIDEPITMGCMDEAKGGGWWYTGSLDETIIFNVALGDDDIMTVMNDGLAMAVSSAGKLATTWADVKAQ